ncbi:hypothetical protein [Staphylococcus xylosus]|uniref:hypothetical protein n=1 Tax=Staphylococcus xylosus TaxID=1288 RepID=UPI0015C5478A|nr:hypothetical protein [Staphylococcus xylosus]NQE00222.1 hypothetical protein [Staphylococcus xylosus]
MGVMMGKIVEVNGKEVQLVLQGLDEKDLIKQVDVINEMERKAKAWDNYIAEVRERVRFTENTEDDIESETQKVINYYMEDE